MTSQRALGAILTISLLSACGPHALAPAASGYGAPDGSLAPQALQQNNGAQFVSYAGIPCSEPLGQVAPGTNGTSMWFAIPTACTKTGGGVGKISLSTGAVTSYRIGKEASPLAIAESGGYVWAVDQHRSGKGRNIYRFSEDGKYQTFSLPNAIAVNGLAAGPDGNLWFCGSYEKSGTTLAGVGKLTPTGTSTLYTMQGAATPVLTSIAAAADGNLWVADQQNGAILRVATGGSVTTFNVGGHPNNIVNVAKALVYSDSSVGQLSVMNFSGRATAYAAPNGAFPGSIASESQSIIAFVDTKDNSSAVGTFNATAGTYASDAKAPNDGLRYMFSGADGNVWFTDAYGHIAAYLNYVLTTSPTQISLSAQKCSASFTAAESGYSGDVSVTSQDSSVATVSPASGASGSSFKVTSVAAGSTSVVIQDTMHNVVSLPVTVSAACQNGQYCPALPGGTGLLADGDFSGDLNEFETVSQGQLLAPNWLVTQATVDLYSSMLWGEPTPSNLCSVDLDGSPGVGGIATQQLPTSAHTTYEVTFYFSANTYGPPSTKHMLVSAANTSETLTWNDANGGAPQGVWVQEAWQFVATGSNTTLAFTSEDKKGSNYGPVMAGVSVSAVQGTREAGFRTLKTLRTPEWARVLPSPLPY
jgi:virginiamycin B lyase